MIMKQTQQKQKKQQKQQNQQSQQSQQKQQKQQNQQSQQKQQKQQNQQNQQKTAARYEREKVMGDEYMIKTDHVTKKYKKTCAIKDLSMSVRKNTVYGLLGPNGAGKSTLLKMMTGIIRPTSGEILFNNHPWSRKDLLKIGSLIESPPLYENLTAFENLKVRAVLLGIGADKCNQVLQKMGLGHTKNKKISDFSLGMKQRLGIALALLNTPRLLVLDEPTNGLDPFGIEELRKMIRTFAESGITVIISSHILNEVQQVADDIGIIHNGSLLYQDKIDANENLEQLFMDIVRKERAS